MEAIVQLESHIFMLSSLHWIAFDICTCIFEDLAEIVNSSAPGQKGGHFTDNVFKCIFVNENIHIVIIEISLKCVLKDPIDNVPPLV